MAGGERESERKTQLGGVLVLPDQPRHFPVFLRDDVDADHIPLVRYHAAETVYKIDVLHKLAGNPGLSTDSTVGNEPERFNASANS